MICQGCKKRIDKRSKITLFSPYVVPKTFLIEHKNHLAGRISGFEARVIAAKLGVRIPNE